MFRIFFTNIQQVNFLFSLHPTEIDFVVEQIWNNRYDLDDEVGGPRHRSDLRGLPLDFGLQRGRFTFSDMASAVTVAPRLWHHLIYAYMVYNTGAYEIFRRIIEEFLIGEKLGTPTPESHHWLRNTEQLFYSSHHPLRVISSLTSSIRPDFKATFFNACWRMFGMDTAYGTKSSQPYHYIKGEPANTDFVAVLEYFLWEVWQAIINQSNQTGPSTKDDAAISNRARQLYDMLLARRSGGNLSRVEFASIMMMDWFHLTLSFNTPIVQALRADSSSPQDRLKKIAKQVGMNPHQYSKSFFDLADPLSRLLIDIELGTYNEVGSVPNLYTTGTEAEAAIRTIITHWSIATGHDLKVKNLPSPVPIN